MFRFLNLLLLLIIVLLQVRLWWGDNSLPESWQLEARIEEQQKVTEALAARNAQLAAEVRDLRSGLDAIEERARYELGMVRKNETFYLLINSTVPENASTDSTSSTNASNTNTNTDSVSSIKPSLEITHEQ